MADLGKAATGAASGAAMGSFAGPWGTAAGGLVGGALGLFSGGDPTVSAQNGFMNDLNTNGSVLQDPRYLSALHAYQNGQGSSKDLMDSISQLPASEQQGAMSNFMSGPAGSQYATEQVQSNPLLSQGLNSMYGQLQAGQGMEGQQNNVLNNLQSQGFQLTPEDRTLYGQEAGQIASQYGQQGNQIANSLAQRGLSDSGAAGAAFSSLAGNQNQQLAAAQQQIAQQRFQNTQSQIAQQQNFLGQLNSQNNQAAGNYASQGSNAINQQYGRQNTGAQDYWGNLVSGSNAQVAQNSGNIQGAQFNANNQSPGLTDYGQGMMSSAMGGFGKTMGQNAASNVGSLFSSSGSAPMSSSSGGPSLGANLGMFGK